MREGPVRVLELRSVRGTGGGPEKTILRGAAGADPRWVHVTVCYVRDARDDVFEIDRRAQDLGVDYVELTERHSFDPSVWAQLRRLVADRHIDVVHSHEYKTDLLAWLLWKRGWCVPLATAHGWTGHSARERLVYYPANKRLLARFPRVIAVSSEIKLELTARGAAPERVDVLLNGIDHRAFVRDPGAGPDARRALGIDPGDVVIGSVGRLEPQKRYDLLIDAFASLSAARPALRLLIAGEGSARPALEAAIRRHGLDARCRLIGHIADVRPFHHALDLFVQSSEYEGTPNVVLEAMALETPVVATDVGGTAEICRAGVDGLIVPPRDTTGLMASIRAALDDPGARTRRVASARRRVETDLSFDRRLRALESIYAQLAGRAAA